MKDSFVFYKSFLGAFELINKRRCWQFLQALCAYAMEGESLPLSASEEAAMSMIRPQLDANRRRYENGKKGAEYGVLGGRPKKEKEGDPKTPNGNENKNENVNANVNVNVNGKKRPLTSVEISDSKTDRERWYAERKNRAESIAYRNRKKAEKIEGFQEAEKALRLWYLNAGKRMAKGEEVDEGEEELLKQNIRLLLKKANMTEHDLEPPYHCPKCEDTGFRKSDGVMCDCYEG